MSNELVGKRVAGGTPGRRRTNQSCGLSLFDRIDDIIGVESFQLLENPMLEDLLHEERVALGFLVDDFHEGFGRAAAAERGEQRRDRLLRQAFQRDSLDETLPDELGQRLLERLADVELDVAVGAQHQDGKLGEVLREMLQEGQTGIVGPVQVVEQPDDRRMTGQAFDERSKAVEEETLLLLERKLDRLWDVFVSSAQRRNQLGDLRRIGPERLAKPPGRQKAHREIKALDPRQVGLTTFQLVAVALEHEEPALARLGQDLLGQPRLADTRFSADEN